MINGIMMGCIYGLIALGLSMIFGVMNIVNFAHGDFVMLSMYLTFWVSSLMSVDTVATIAFTLPLLSPMTKTRIWLLLTWTAG